MRRERGFTLIEVIVALTVAALVVLLAERLFAGVGDAGRAVVAARTALDREANARRWLTSVFLSVEVGGTSGPFEGTSDRVTFSSWLETDAGWFERRRVTLARVGTRFMAIVAPTDSITLADSVDGVVFEYLMESGEHSLWMRDWISGVSAPLAVRLRVARDRMVDTLPCAIKERG